MTPRILVKQRYQIIAIETPQSVLEKAKEY